MSDRNKPFWERSDLTFNYPGVRQVMDTCVFAANAGAVNHLAECEIWTLGSLIDAGAKAGHWLGGPPIGEIAISPVTNEVGYVFNDKSQAALTDHTVRQWVESESRIVVLSRPLVDTKQQQFHGWQMLTLVAWDTDHYIAWDSGRYQDPRTGNVQTGKMTAVYEQEIEQGIAYQNGCILIPHPNHDAFVYWKREGGNT